MNLLTSAIRDLHSNMDRLKATERPNDRHPPPHLHSNMDRLKAGTHCDEGFCKAFTFQYG